MITEMTVSADEWAEGTGWHLEESGWCSGDRCIPLAGLTRDHQGRFDTAQLAAATSRGVYSRPDVWGAGVVGTDLVSVGPEHGDQSVAMAGRALPDLTLQDRNGNVVSLDSLVGRRRRMVLHAWAPW